MSAYAPATCPACGSGTAITRVSCRSCDTEVTGTFERCEFCALGAEDRETLRVFLASRGNMKELERHLGVSYPTARARFDDLLAKLGIDREASGSSRVEILDALARREIDVDEAMERLR